MSPRRRRRVVAPLQASAIAARSGGFWRISDRAMRFDGSIGTVESFRFISA